MSERGRLGRHASCHGPPTYLHTSALPCLGAITRILNNAFSTS